MSTPTNPVPTATKVAINSLEDVSVSYSDGKTIRTGTNSITNAVANQNAPIQMLHDALTAFHSSAVSSAKQAGFDAAVAAMEPAHTFLASIFAKGALTPGDIKAGAAAVAEASHTAAQRALAKAQMAADAANEALARLKAQSSNEAKQLPIRET